MVVVRGLCFGGEACDGGLGVGGLEVVAVVGEEDDVADDGEGGREGGEEGAAMGEALVQIGDDDGEDGGEGVWGDGEELGLG